MTARRALALIAVLAGVLAACSRVVDLTIDAQIAAPDSRPVSDAAELPLPDGGFLDAQGPGGG